MELKPKASDKPEKERKNDFERIHGDHLRSLLEPGETLLGVAAVNWQRSLFKQTVSALGVTGSRLIIQPLDRKGRMSGEAPVFIRKEEITNADDRRRNAGRSRRGPLATQRRRGAGRLSRRRNGHLS